MPTLLPPACQTQILVFKSRRHAVDLRFAETVWRRFVTPLRHRLADLTRYFTRLRSIQFDTSSVFVQVLFAFRHHSPRLILRLYYVFLRNPDSELDRSSVFEGWQCLKDFCGFGPIENQIVLANLSVAEDEDPFSELRDVMLVCNQFNC